jgi:hypothetical protein
MSVYQGRGLTRGQAAALSRPGTAAGRFLWLTPPGVGLATVGSPSAAAGRLTIYPALITEPDPVVSLFIETTTGGAGSSVKVGIWANDPVVGWPVGLPLIAINTPIDTSVAEVDTVAVAATPLPVGQWVWVLSNWTGTAPVVGRVGSCAGIVAAPAASLSVVSFFSVEAFATDISTLNLTGRSWGNSGSNVLAVGVGY